MNGSDSLSGVARRLLDEEDRLLVSSICCWEVATLVRKGRLGLDREVNEWVPEALGASRVEELPVTAEIGTEAGGLENFHGDPADRLLAASAKLLQRPLLTKDRRLREFLGDLAVW